MADLCLKGVSNRFLTDINLRVPDRTLFAVVGPSGAGKTSLLRVVAGLAGHRGQVLVGGREVQDLPPHHREIGYVSQDIHLFPHLTLEGNLFLAMDRSGWDRTKKRRQASELIDLLRIRPLAGRKPHTFSGGEKQRAALARVLASCPKILLLDEPFGKLDFRTARYLRAEFKHLHQELDLTTILVTHNLEEAEDLADTTAVMNSGNLVPAQAPVPGMVEDNRPEDSFLEHPNILSCRPVRSLEFGLVEVQWAGGLLFIPDEGRPFHFFSVKGRDIELNAVPPPGPSVNRFSGRISRLFLGDDSVRITVVVDGEVLFAEMTHLSWEKAALSPGDQVHGLIPLKALAPHQGLSSFRDKGYNAHHEK